MKQALTVFGREPIAGQTKTRLAATIGTDRATAIYRALLAHTLNCAKASDAHIVLSLANEPTAAFRSSIDVDVEIQSAGDLGERMSEALMRRFDEGFDRAAIIGTDCLGLEPRHLDAAFASLDRVPVVFGPAADGGYWLVAQRPPLHDVFSGIPYSDPRTLQASLERAQYLGIDAALLDTLLDADTEADLRLALEAHQVVDALAATLREMLAEARAPSA